MTGKVTYIGEPLDFLDPNNPIYNTEKQNKKKKSK